MMRTRTYSKCCFISLSSAYFAIPLMNKVRFTCERRQCGDIRVQFVSIRNIISTIILIDALC